MTTRDIIADIQAILAGDLSGEAQVRGVLEEARDKIERHMIAFRDIDDYTRAPSGSLYPEGEDMQRIHMIVREMRGMKPMWIKDADERTEP